jgi:CRP-like cAMP-binding protein
MATIDALITKIETNAVLGDGDRSLLARLPIFTKKLRAGDDFVPQGSVPEHSAFIIDGVLAKYQVFPDGERQTVSFHFKGEMPDLHSVFITRMDHALSAIRDTNVGLIRHEDLRTVIDKSPTLTAILWRETLIDGAIFRQWIANNGKRGALQGTSHLLCELFTRVKAVGLLSSDGSWLLPLTQQQLADAVGISIVHINRTLRTLKQSGLVAIEQGRLRVLDWERLVRTAGFDPLYLHLIDQNTARAPVAKAAGN